MNERGKHICGREAGKRPTRKSGCAKLIPVAHKTRAGTIGQEHPFANSGTPKPEKVAAAQKRMCCLLRNR